MFSHPGGGGGGGFRQLLRAVVCDVQAALGSAMPFALQASPPGCAAQSRNAVNRLAQAMPIAELCVIWQFASQTCSVSAFPHGSA
jgi:hypothetical protein